MFNDTCLAALKIKDWSPHINDLESLHTLHLENLRMMALERNLLTLKLTITQMQLS
jgi:hypothetical protein